MKSEGTCPNGWFRESLWAAVFRGEYVENTKRIESEDFENVAALAERCLVVPSRKKFAPIAAICCILFETGFPNGKPV